MHFFLSFVVSVFVALERCKTACRLKHFHFNCELSLLKKQQGIFLAALGSRYNISINLFTFSFNSYDTNYFQIEQRVEQYKYLVAYILWELNIKWDVN